MVAGNLLTDLPRELLDCQNLEGVRIAANQLTDAPDWLLGLPRLAWYSDAGNPFCDTRRADNNAALPSIPWSDLDIGTKLGESAKNVVHKGVIRSTGQEVAVKIYGGELTTDGYPIDEMRANIAAGRHEHLIDILGIVTGAPAGQQALVMQLVASDYSAPGQPPSLETFTRDVYPPDTSFSLSVATEILHGVASALQHLHRRGVMHGDVYAHNLLANPEGRCVVGDLGGASLYDVSAGPAREYIDVLAFGVLMDELLMRCKEQGLTIAALRDLQQRCLHEKAAARPLFTGILDSLAVARNV
jgi:serine/threonine protein kinase